MKLKLIRLKKNIKNYIRSKQAAKNEPGLIRRGDESGKLIEKVIIEKYQLRELQLIPEQVDNAQQPTVEVQKFDSVDQIVIKQLQGVDSETYDKHILTAIYNDLDVTS